MFLVLVTALVAVCGADKLDRTYLPPVSANTAGGSPGSLQTPFKSFNGGLGRLPQGGYSNEFEGVVVDAAAPGTRASGPDATGLGAPRITYGSTDSKVGEAAFTSAFPRVGAHSGAATGFINRDSASERPQASRDRASETVKYENDVNHDSFNYAFETDNGIVAEENGIEVNGVKAQGGYSYTSDDGQVYSVSYTADEGGYQPRGDHLPTPPPIPAEILKSLEQNAKEEAAGVVDDGSYDAQKYNTEDYTKTDSTNGQYGPPTRGRPQTDADSSNSFINQNNKLFARPSNQFGSAPVQSSSGFGSIDISKNVQSGGNFGVAYGVNKTSNGQAFGFASGGKNEYLPPTSGFNSNRGQPQGAQSNTPNGFPDNRGSSSVAGGNGSPNKDQNSESTFIPLSQQKLQGDSPKRPQGTPVFGKPTIIDSTLSIKDPFAPRPSSNRFTQNKQPAQRPQSNAQIGGSFEVVSGNVYSSKNEYLPPRRQFNKLNQNKGTQGFQSGADVAPKPLTDFKSQSYGVGSNTPSATAFSSVSRPTSGFQSQFTGQQTQFGNGLSTLDRGTNKQPFNKDQSQFSTGSSNIPSLNSAPPSQYRPSTFSSQFPTSQPNKELTTPLEHSANEKSSAPVPIVDGPDAPSLAGPSSPPSFGLQSSSSILGQSSFNKYQQVSPTVASASAFSSIGDSFNTHGSQPGLSKFQQVSPTTASAFSLVSGSSIASGSQNVPGFGEYGYSKFNQASSTVATAFSSVSGPSISSGPQNIPGAGQYSYNKFNQASPTVASAFSSVNDSPSSPGSQNIPGSGQYSLNQFNQAFPTASSAFSSISGSSISPGPQNAPGSFGVNVGSVFPNRAPFDVQFATSTLRPSFGQNIQQQGPDDSYYYNAPSKPFNIPTARPQFSSFPSSPSDQPFRVTQTPFGTQPQAFDYSQTSFNKNPIGSTRYPNAPSPTQPTEQNSNNFQSQFNKVTQASASSFSTPAPTASVDFNKNQFGQFNTRPQQTRPQVNQGSSVTNQPIASFGQPTRDQGSQKFPENGKPDSSPFQSQETQQYSGEIYEYNKPPQTLPAPENSKPSQGQSGLISQTGSSPQASQPKNPGSYNPSFQFGSFNQPSIAGQTPQNSQNNQGFNVNTQVQSQPQSETRPGQFGSQPLTQGLQQTFNRPEPSKLPGQANYNGQAPSESKPTSSQTESKPGQYGSIDQNRNPVQGASKFPPAYDKNGPPCCKQANSGTQSSQTNEQNKAPSFGTQGTQNGFTEPSQGTRPTQSVSSFAGIGENFGGPRKPPSFDANGYHY